MKLIKRTYLYTFIWLLPVMVIGSIYCFYMIRHIIYEETDEFLTYEMERLVNYHKTNNILPEFHKVADIIEGKKVDPPLLKDTLLLEPGDNEMVPHRELHFSIIHKDKYFTIVLRQLMPGNDDIFRGTILIIAGLMLLITIILFLMLNSISGTMWKPFYKTLNTITKYRITDEVPVLDKSGINEFNILNETVHGLLKKISHDYKRTKEFNENASHELQTHLAIIRANTEKLLNDPVSKTNTQKIRDILNATVKLSRAQKSLLLLSKIGNLEYNKKININLKDILHQILAIFNEAVDIRKISVNVNSEDCYQVMDPGLTEIMLTNLVKNAVKHNINGGFISIQLNQSKFMIKNSGLPYNGSPESLMDRFRKGTGGNLGVGLSIVKQICELYNFNISYQIAENSIHTISIDFKH